MWFSLFARRRSAWVVTAVLVMCTGPVLLLTLVGGLWGFGARGLILAPAALVLALSAWDALTSLYTEDPVLTESDGDSTGHA